MRTILTKLSAVLAGLLLLGSCDLSMTDTYAFTNVLYYTVNEESREDVVIDFFKTYIDFDESYTFTGSQ